jgi:hypothetical protein
MWYLIGFVWIALMSGIVYAYRRKQSRRSTERAAQMAALLADLKANAGAALKAANSTSLPGADERASAPVAVAASPQFSKKPRLLPPDAALLYYVFRAGLPDHEIFAGLALDDVIDIAPAADGTQREQLLRRLALLRVDLVVCTKQLEVVAAVVAGGAARAADSHFATESLQAAGIRVVSVDLAAPPRHHQVHSLIYG